MNKTTAIQLVFSHFDQACCSRTMTGSSRPSILKKTNSYIFLAVQLSPISN